MIESAECGVRTLCVYCRDKFFCCIPPICERLVLRMFICVFTKRRGKNAPFAQHFKKRNTGIGAIERIQYTYMHGVSIYLEGPSPVLYSPAGVAGVYLINFCIRNLSYIPLACNPAVQSFCSM